MITRREALKLATITAAGAFGNPIRVEALDASNSMAIEEDKSNVSLRFVVPDGDGTGLMVSSPGNLGHIPKWLVECDSLIVELLPGTYSSYLHLSDVPQSKRVLLQGDALGRTVFLSTDGSHNGSITVSNCHNVSVHNIHFRQNGVNLKWFLNITGSKDCSVHRCSWVGLSCRYGAATIQNESERVTISDCVFEDTGNRGNSGTGSHQLYISGGGDNATTGYVRDIHVVRCTFADHFAGQHLKFKNGACDCFVERCTFLRTDGETHGRFLNIRNCGDPEHGYPTVTNIFILRSLFKDTTGSPSTIVNPAPTGYPKQYVFAQNKVEGSVTGLPDSV